MQSETIKSRRCDSASAGARKIFGCDQLLPKHLIWRELNFEFDRCPCFYVKDADFIRDAFRIWKWNQKGYLPHSGAWLEQPNLIIEVIEFIDFLIVEKQYADSKTRNRNAVEGQKGPQKPR